MAGLLVKVAAGVASCALVLSGSAASAADCVGEHPAKLFPGVMLGAKYPAVKAQVPRSAGCASRRKESCQFVDRYGVLNLFSGFEPQAGGGRARDLYMRTQVRARGGWLPYGVSWSDSQAQAMAKLKLHGGRTRPEQPAVITMSGCWSPASDGYSVDFEFDGSGRLSRVRQAFQQD